MINDHQSLKLFGLPLFTWVDIDTPMYDGLALPPGACFTYFVHGSDQVLSKQHGIKALSEHAVLSVCGFTLGKMLMEQEPGRVNSVIIHFQPEILKEVYKNSKPPYWEEISAPVTQFVAQMAATNLIKHYIDGVKGMFKNKEAVTDDILILKLREIILLLMQTEDMPKVSQIIRSLFSERSFTFKETVEAYLFTPATIENLATLTNTSLSTFKREFIKIYGKTPHRYIMERRIEKVAHLLKVSDDSISEIGYECGFTSPAHLTRVFKTKFKKTPTQYRLSQPDKQLDF